LILVINYSAIFIPGQRPSILSSYCLYQDEEHNQSACKHQQDKAIYAAFISITKLLMVKLRSHNYSRGRGERRREGEGEGEGEGDKDREIWDCIQYTLCCCREYRTGLTQYCSAMKEDSYY
jgi:hypothetical protein